jgi:hypothetical protein
MLPLGDWQFASPRLERGVMAISAISTAVPPPLSQQATQALGHHKRGGHHASSLSDIDVQGSSVATAPSSTGKIGSKLDVTA